MFVPTIFITAFAFSIGFDQVTTKWWDKHNYPVSRPAGCQGLSIAVGRKTSPTRAYFCSSSDRPLAAQSSTTAELTSSQKQWKDIREKYIKADEEDDE